eukprot:CAMPEP_0115854588 /NCGR_PEP_ID=MMETSP0287-20121206/14102_1 /TAXON_ID=412157 /ORGANISM="Chrysochromulina rotalis, Strain UIO044" /LENGTH=323 /DNA_ID=CAMNT_0003308711 /DNA_START=21 /DNA_END=992 /DNA_ORIENTATION=-
MRTWSEPQPVNWLPPATVGPCLSDDSRTIRAEIGNMPDKYGGCVADDFFCNGTTVLCFSVVTNDHANIAVGVADSAKEMTTTSGPHAWGLHLGKGRLIQALNGHRIAGPTQKAYRSAVRKEYKKDKVIKVVFVLEMDASTGIRRLSVTVGDRTPLDTGFVVSEVVRPWVWLGGPGCGHVWLDKFQDDGLDATPSLPSPPRSSEGSDHAVGDDAPSTIDTFAGGLGLVESESADARRPSTENAMPNTTLNLKSTMEELSVLDGSDGASWESLSSRTDSTSGSDELRLELWTERATAWLQPLQQRFQMAFGLKDSPVPEDAELTA